MLSPANKGRLCFSSQVTSKGPGPFTLPFVLLVSAVFSVNPRLRGLEVAALVGGFSCTRYLPGEEGFWWASLSWRGSLGLASRGRLTSVLFLSQGLIGVHSETSHRPGPCGHGGRHGHVLAAWRRTVCASGTGAVREGRGVGAGWVVRERRGVGAGWVGRRLGPGRVSRKESGDSRK